VKLPIDPGEAIVVVGALATKPPDRDLQRHEIHPVQVFTADGVEPVPALDYGEFGMSALVIRAEAGVVYGSSGNDFFRVDLADGTITDLGVDLKDSHEVTEIDGTLWIANTGRDEAVAFDLATRCDRRERAHRRLRAALRRARRNPRPRAPTRPSTSSTPTRSCAASTAGCTCSFTTSTASRSSSTSRSGS
jgi:hypothetical protein